MIRAKVLKNSVVTNQGDFDTQQLAEAWIQEQSSAGSFGEQNSFSVAYQDVSADYALRNSIMSRSKKRAFGEQMVDKISALNDTKNLSVEQVDAFMSDALISSLREHLWAGNISTFASKLTNSDVSTFFSSQEKSTVLSDCQSFLESLGE